MRWVERIDLDGHRCSSLSSVPGPYDKGYLDLRDAVLASRVGGKAEGKRQTP